MVNMGCGQSKESLINNINSQIGALVERKKRLEVEKIAAKEKKENEAEKNREMENEKKNLTIEKTNLDHDVKTLKGKIEKEKSSGNDQRELELIKEKEEKIKELKRESDEFDEAERKGKEGESENSKSNAKLVEVSEEIEGLRRKIEEIDGKIAEINAKNQGYADLSKTFQEMTDELHVDKATHAELKEQAKEFIRQEGLDVKRKELQERFNTLNSSLAELTRNSQVVEELQQKVHSSQHEIKELTHELASYAHLEEERKKFVEIKNENAKLRNDFNEAKEINEKVLELTADVASLEGLVERISAETSETKGKLDAVNDEIASLGVSEAATDDTHDDFEKEIEKLKHHIHKKQKKAEEYEEKSHKKLQKLEAFEGKPEEGSHAKRGKGSKRRGKAHLG